MACAFCQRDVKLTDEHVWPDWTAKYMRQSGAGTQERVVIRATGIERQSWSAYPSAQTVRGTCEDCNNGWLNDLEEAKPHLLPMILGQDIIPDEAAQIEIATWATKTALVAGIKFDPATPQTFYDHLYQHRQPHPGSRIWLATSNERYITYIDHRPLRVAVADIPSDTHNGYASLLAIGHLCLYVFARDTEDPPTKDFPGASSRAFAPIWPVQGPVRWPNAERLVLDLRALDDFADTIGTLAP